MRLYVRLQKSVDYIKKPFKICWFHQLGGHCDHSTVWGFWYFILVFYLEGECSGVICT
jgi:hypothetical protein